MDSIESRFMRLVFTMVFLLVIGCGKAAKPNAEQREMEQAAQFGAFARRHGAVAMLTSKAQKPSLTMDIQSEIQAAKNQSVAFEAYLEDVLIEPDGRIMALLWPSNSRFSEHQVDLKVTIESRSVDILQNIHDRYSAVYLIVKDMNSHVERGTDGDLKVVVEGFCPIVEIKSE